MGMIDSESYVQQTRELRRGEGFELYTRGEPPDRLLFLSEGRTQREREESN